MDTIWDIKSLEVGGQWLLCGGDVQTNDHAKPTKVERYAIQMYLPTSGSM